MTASLDTLTQINLDDLVSSFGWHGRPLLEKPLRIIFRRPARIFAHQMLTFDSMVATHGRENVPAGPFIALANHPGMIDTLALFAALQRHDLRIIAVHNPFLGSLPNIMRRLDIVTDQPRTGISLIRHVRTHLKSGGAVLTFPSGRIEPDPNVYPGAEEALQDWTDSAGVFVRFAPATAVVPVLVRGVIWPRTARHPLTRLKGSQIEREKLAAALQLLAHVVLKTSPLDVTVQFGNPITVERMGTKDKNAIHKAVLSEMRRLLAIQPEGLCEYLC
jgi:1-acyl-sn-glycerol-3-phosphate acyltransferase